MGECTRPGCGKPAVYKFLIEWDGLPRVCGSCREHAEIWRAAWAAGNDPVDNLGITLEDPAPDPGKPGYHATITVQEPPEGA